MFLHITGPVISMVITNKTLIYVLEKILYLKYYIKMNLYNGWEFKDD